MDVADAQQIEVVFQQIIRTYGTIDILVNNAGYGIFSAIDELSMEQYEKMMDTNYMGVVRCTKLALPIMKAAGKGHIVNVASLAGMIGSAKSTSYSATKHAVLGFTNSLRMELKGTGIAVSSVNPGPIATAFFNIADPNGTYTRNINWLMMKPEYVVRKMIKLLHTQRAELNLPPLSAFVLKVYGLCPRFIDKWAGKWLNKK
jgi:short-subunit dehydrogenase